VAETAAGYPAPVTDAGFDYDHAPVRTRDRPLFGMLLLGVGAVWLLSQAHVLHLAAETLLSLLLIAIGVSLVLTGRTGGRKLPIILGAVVTVLLLSNPTHVNAWMPHAAGNSYVQPQTVDDLRPYREGFGNMTIDLTSLVLPAGTTTVDAEVGFGNLTVRVPDGAAVRVDAGDGAGNVTIEGQRLGGGLVTDQPWTSAGYDRAADRLELKLRVGAGNIDVVAISSSPQPKSGEKVPTPPDVPVPPSPPGANQ